jgi:hypothetical protein
VVLSILSLSIAGLFGRLRELEWRRVLRQPLEQVGGLDQATS